jgi:hypothetical protein
MIHDVAARVQHRGGVERSLGVDPAAGETLHDRGFQIGDHLAVDDVEGLQLVSCHP